MAGFEAGLEAQLLAPWRLKAKREPVGRVWPDERVIGELLPRIIFTGFRISCGDGWCKRYAHLAKGGSPFGFL